MEEPDLEPGEEETGPWTVTEAWLLFEPDSWPASKKALLPTWATAASADAGARGPSSIATSIARAGGFGSARGLLERERTAQGTGVLRDEAGVY